MKEITSRIFNLSAKWRITVLAVYILLITYLSLAPAKALPDIRFGIPHSDKLAHFFMYGFFVVVLRWSVNGTHRINWNYSWILILAIFYGMLMEFFQWMLFYVSQRTFEVGDFVANSIGATVFWVATNRFFNKQHRAD